MPIKAHVDQITVDTPCSVKWDSMNGNDEIRFCRHCKLSVHNLSALTRKQVSRLIKKSDGRLCIQYVRRADGLIATRPARQKLHQIHRHASRLAAGAFSAALSMTTAAQQPAPHADSTRRLHAVIDNLNLHDSQTPNSVLPTGTVSGSVKDIGGSPIPGSSIALLSPSGTGLFAIADTAGEFKFDQVAVGEYTLRSEAPNFNADESNVYVIKNGLHSVNLVMRQVEAVEEVIERRRFVAIGGAVAFVAPKDPLILASQQDDLQEVQRLLAGRDVNLRDSASHTTALEHAVRNANRELIQLLLAAGAEVNLKDRAGETVLMMLDSDATSDIVWDLINSGGKVNETDEEGDTPLIEAASVNNVEVLKTLLEAGAKVNTKNKEGKTALMLAAEEGLINNVRALILAGAELNALDDEGKNALTYATDNDRTAVIRLLKAQGCEIAVAKSEEQN